MEQQIVISSSKYDLSCMEDGSDKRVMQYIGTTKTIREIGAGNNAVLLAATVFRECADIVGAKVGTDEEWKCTQRAIFDALQSSYGGLTYEEVRNAFRMLLTQELDAYLPRDASGEPKKECIGRFKPAFFTRVMDAYKKRRSDAQQKYYQALQDRIREEDMRHTVTAEEDARVRGLVREVYERWKSAAHELITRGGEDVLVYDWLVRNRLIEEQEPSIQDKQAAYSKYMERKQERNPYEVRAVEKQGFTASNLQSSARLIMIHRRLVEAFLVFEQKKW
jgi:hypothetical protein